MCSMSRRQGLSNCWPAGHMRHLRSLNVLHVPKTGLSNCWRAGHMRHLRSLNGSLCPEDRGSQTAGPAGHMRHLRSLNVLYVPRTGALKLLACRSHAPLEVPKCAPCPEDRALKLLACRSHAALEVPKWFSMSRRQGLSNCWPAGHMRHLRSLNGSLCPEDRGSQTAGLQVTCGTWGP